MKQTEAEAQGPGLGGYGARVDHALERAAAAGDANDRARVLVAAARTLPRFPSLAGHMTRLLAPILEPDTHPDQPELEAAAWWLLLRTMVIAGQDRLVATIRKGAEALPDGGPLAAWTGTLAAALSQAGEGSFDTARGRLARAEKLAGGIGDAAARTLGWDPRPAIDLAIAREVIARRHGQLRGALDAAESLSALLAEGGPEWGGERYHAAIARGINYMQRNEPAQAAEAASAARELALGRGLAPDTAAATTAAVPVLLHLGETDRALAYLGEAIRRLGGDPQSWPQEQVLRQLSIRALEVKDDVAGAIEAGFEAIERSGKVGTVAEYVGFTATVAKLYQQAGALLDAYHVLHTAERALGGRQDAAMGRELVARLEEALRADIGDARYEALVREHERLGG